MQDDLESCRDATGELQLLQTRRIIMPVSKSRYGRNRFSGTIDSAERHQRPGGHYDVALCVTVIGTVIGCATRLCTAKILVEELD